MIIAVDFDGTLHTGIWPNIGVPAPYAIEVMQRLRKSNHFIILWSCREGQLLTNAINWMSLRSIPFDLANENHPDNIIKYGGNSRKIYADMYVDDKNAGGFPGWLEIERLVSEMDSEKI